MGVTLPILPNDSSKEAFLVALNEADKLLTDNLFFKKLAKRMGKTDAKRKEQDENTDFVLGVFDADPAKAIMHYNLRAANRNGINNSISIIVNFALMRLQELLSAGMSEEEAKEVIVAEISDTDTDIEEEDFA